MDWEIHKRKKLTLSTRIRNSFQVIPVKKSSLRKQSIQLYFWKLLLGLIRGKKANLNNLQHTSYSHRKAEIFHEECNTIYFFFSSLTVMSHLTVFTKLPTRNWDDGTLRLNISFDCERKCKPADPAADYVSWESICSRSTFSLPLKKGNALSWKL